MIEIGKLPLQINLKAGNLKMPRWKWVQLALGASRVVNVRDGSNYELTKALNHLKGSKDE